MANTMMGGRAPVIATVLVLVTMLLAAACGGSGGGDPSVKNEGAAAVAVAQYFRQEAAGAKLPEGVNVSPSGTGTIKPLDKQSTSARVCVEYIYTALDTTPAVVRTRVYVASLVKGAWSIEAVKPDGTCADVA